MGLEAAPDVRFDYDGALRLARRLYRLGNSVDELMSNRVALAETALTDWLGPYGTQFAERITTEQTAAVGMASDLREGARQWAARWAEAMNEQNSINHAREVKRVEDDRNAWDKFAGHFVGHNDLPPNPGTITVPVEPNFFATGTLTTY